ncbi:MAG: HAD family phosphatase [Bacillota bacterium]|nr:HAD family phosphatase [Bacillota bacterium]
MFKAVIFDMDGIIFDTERLSMEGWKYAGEKTGFFMPTDILMKTIGINRVQAQKLFMDRFGENFDLQFARKFKLEYEKRYIEEHGVPKKKGLDELLSFLRERRYKTAIATSTDRNRTMFNLENAGIKDFFDCVVCGDMVSKGKPDPEIYETACRLLDVKPEDCLVLEDSPVGIMSAYGAKTKPVNIPDLITPDESLSEMIYARVDSLLDVIPILS